jgi:hypothetical protein
LWLFFGSKRKPQERNKKIKKNFIIKLKMKKPCFPKWHKITINLAFLFYIIFIMDPVKNESEKYKATTIKKSL